MISQGRESESQHAPFSDQSFDSIPVTIIRPSRGWVALKLSELWEYRELLYFLTWREVKVRYKQTALGAAWAIIQPLLTMLIFSLFFGKLAKVPSDRIPYPLFCLAGLVPWTFFFEWTFPIGEQPGFQLKPDFQGLFSAPDLTVIRDIFGRHRFHDLLCAAGRDDGLLPANTDPSLHIPAVVLPACIRYSSGCRSMAFCTQRGVPRRALYDSVPGTVLDDCDPHRVSLEPAQGTMASHIRTEPNGGCCRGVSLGAVRSQHGSRAYDRRFILHCNVDVNWRSILLSANGKNLCGRGVKRGLTCRVGTCGAH